jgi:hypothetical protein
MDNETASSFWMRVDAKGKDTQSRKWANGHPKKTGLEDESLAMDRKR